MVWGPDDPAEGETTQLVRATLARKVPMAPKGRVPIVDVRDVARVFAAAARPGRGPRRYLACGELVEMLDVFRIAAAAAGVKPPRGRMPTSVALIFGRIADAAQRLIPAQLPASYQGLWVVANGPTALDASPTTAELGISFRPAEETIRDTVAWIRNEAT